MTPTTSGMQLTLKAIYRLADKTRTPFLRLLNMLGARLQVDHVSLQDPARAPTPTKFILQALRLRPMEVRGSLLFLLPEVRDALWLSPDQVSDVLTPDQWRTVETANGLCNIFVNEAAVYSLAFISAHPKAREFARWVSGTVLPEVRHQGTFMDSAS